MSGRDKERKMQRESAPAAGPWHHDPPLASISRESWARYARCSQRCLQSHLEPSCVCQPQRVMFHSSTTIHLLWEIFQTTLHQLFPAMWSEVLQESSCKGLWANNIFSCHHYDKRLKKKRITSIWHDPTHVYTHTETHRYVLPLKFSLLRDSLCSSRLLL